jgi:Aldo/keto reductase family/NAD(P)H-binding
MRMRYKLLGRTGLRVSELCLGAMIFGDHRGGWGASKEEAARIVERFAEAGGNFIDTANSYAGGESERIVGELVATERERWVLSTKYTLSMRPDDPNGGGAHRKSLVQSLEASLRRLGTDYLDHPMSLARAKHAAEQALQASGLPWTIIRPAAYLETWIAITGAKLTDNGQTQVFGPGRNPINFVSADDVAAVVDLAVHDPSLRGQLLEVAGPENLSFAQLAERLIAASGKPGRTRHVPLPMLRAMSVLARPVAPAFARQAQAAVVMNTTDMTVNLATIRDRFPAIPATTLDEVLRRQPPLRVSR